MNTKDKIEECVPLMTAMHIASDRPLKFSELGMTKEIHMNSFEFIKSWGHIIPLEDQTKISFMKIMNYSIKNVDEYLKRYYGLSIGIEQILKIIGFEYISSANNGYPWFVSDESYKHGIKKCYFGEEGRYGWLETEKGGLTYFKEFNQDGILLSVIDFVGFSVFAFINNTNAEFLTSKVHRNDSSQNDYKWEIVDYVPSEEIYTSTLKGITNNPVEIILKTRKMAEEKRKKLEEFGELTSHLLKRELKAKNDSIEGQCRLFTD